MTQKPQPEPEIIGLREFARLNGVKLASIQDAIKAGRISSDAIVVVKQGKRELRKLYKDLATADWEQVHARAEASPITAILKNQSDELTPEELALFEETERNGFRWGVYKTQQEALLARAKRKIIEKENLELEGKLHQAEDVAAVWSDILIRFRTRLLSVPSSIAPIIASLPKPDPAAIQTVIESHLHEVLTELSGYDKSRIESERRKRVGK